MSMMSNMSVEELAIMAVIQYEVQRLSLQDTSLVKVVKQKGYDVLSYDGRTIEVKGTSGNKLSKGLVLNSRDELEHLMGGGYLYRVLNCRKSPEIHVFQIADLNIKEVFRASVSIKRKG